MTKYNSFLLVLKMKFLIYKIEKYNYINLAKLKNV